MDPRPAQKRRQSPATLTGSNTLVGLRAYGLWALLPQALRWVRTLQARAPVVPPFHWKNGRTRILALLRLFVMGFRVL